MFCTSRLRLKGLVRVMLIKITLLKWLNNMFKHSFLLSAIAASAAFALMTLLMDILTCKFLPGVCYVNLGAITFKATLLIFLVLFFRGFAMNSIFFIGCAVYKKSNFKHKCMRYVLSGIGPIIIFLLYYLLSIGKFPEITWVEIENALELCLSGLVSGFVFNWVEQRINK